MVGPRNTGSDKKTVEKKTAQDGGSFAEVEHLDGALEKREGEVIRD